MARIELQNVGLTFHVRNQTGITLKEFVVGWFRSSPHPVNALMEVKALQGLDLVIEQGDRLGVLGHNGAGKSTLLKLLAGIYPPTEGKLHVEGRISSLFDINLGFEPDASGWDNIGYRSYLQGETPWTIKDKRQGIAEFSELGEYLNMPVRYYSAGMQVRLAFSIATAIEPEVLLIDEVLSVGDMSFQRKAKARMREMMAKAQLIVVVSHDLKSLAEICNRVIWLDHGRVVKAGPAEEVIEAYRKSVKDRVTGLDRPRLERPSPDKPKGDKPGSERAA
jgi:ABC-type polysaccharide/polyol phosphate transport system ATPase subunit